MVNGYGCFSCRHDEGAWNNKHRHKTLSLYEKEPVLRKSGMDKGLEALNANLSFKKKALPKKYEAGLKCGADFKMGYSPERINPGDEAHTLDKITKIVAGMNEETTEILAELYGLINNIYKAKDIKTAEAAKGIENIQRDLNTLFLFRKKKTSAKRKNNNSFGKAFLFKP